MGDQGSWIAAFAHRPAEEFWPILITVAGFTLVFGYAVFRFLTRARLIEDIPTSRVRSANQGYVELMGTGDIMQGVPVVAPLTGMHCAWYRYRVQQHYANHHRHQGLHVPVSVSVLLGTLFFVAAAKGTRFGTIRGGTSDELFLLRDATGVCVIDPDDAEVRASTKQSWHEGGYHYTEERIHIGEPLYAIGEFRTIGGTNDAFDDGAEMRDLLAQWKQHRRQLLEVFDENRDGDISPQEWDTVRDAAHAVVKKQQARRATQPTVNTLSKPRDGRPFLIASSSQKALARRYRWYVGGSLVAFFAATLFTLLTLTLRYSG